jgi:hypothetical protein
VSTTLTDARLDANLPQGIVATKYVITEKHNIVVRKIVANQQNASQLYTTIIHLLTFALPLTATEYVHTIRPDVLLPAQITPRKRVGIIIVDRVKPKQAVRRIAQ